MVRLSSLVLFVSASFQAVADVAITETYVIINSGSGNYYYEGKDNGGTNTPFSTINATVNLLASPTLTLNGGQTKTSASGGDYQNNTNYENLYYRFYDSAGAAGSYTTISESYSASQPAYPNYTWETSNSNINLISGKASGTYYLDVYWDGNGSWWNGSSQQYYTSSANTYGSSGSPIRATYTLFYGATATGTQASAFTGTGYFNFNGSGQTYTLNAANTYTGQTQIDAGTVSITSTGSLSSSSVVYLGNGGNSSNAALTLAGTTTFANALTANQSSGSGTRTITKSDATSQTMSGSITLNQLTTFDVASGGSLTLSGVVGGTNSFTKTSAGTMTLSGTSANTFSVGTVTVSAGTLVLNKSANTAAINGRPVLVSSGATLRTDAAGQIGSAPLVTATGTFDLNGNNQSVALGGAGTVKLDGSTASGTLTITNSGTDTFSGLITDNSRTDGAVTKAGTGMQILTGTNAYDGLTTVNGGVLRIGQANALGSTTGGTTVSTGAVLELSNSIAVGAEALTLNGDGVSAGGSLRNVNGNNSWSGSITNNGARINADSGTTLTISGAISNAASQALYVGGAGNVILSGNLTMGTVSGGNALFLDTTSTNTISGSNSGLTGGVRVASSGTVLVGSANALGSGDLTFAPSTTATIASTDANSRTLGNATTYIYGTGLNLGLATTGTGSLTFGAVNLGNDASGSNQRTITTATGTSHTFGAVAGGANNTLIKAGSGTLILSAASGTTGGFQLNLGTIRIGNNSALGTGNLTLNGGTIASDSGTARSLANSVSIGGDVTLGETSTGTGALTFSSAVGLGGSPRQLTVIQATTFSGAVTNGSLTKAGSAQLTLGNASTSFSTLTVNAGTVSFSESGAITGLQGAGTVDIASTKTLTATLASDFGFSGLLTGAGSLTKAGSAVLTLSGNSSSYSGNTTVSAGVLRIGHSSALGATTGATTVSSGAALELSNNIAVGAEVLTLNGDGISFGGSLRNVNGNNSWAGSITNNNMARINSDSGTLTISGAISNVASQSLYFGGAGNVTVDGTITGNLSTTNGALYKDGAGTLTLSANNSGLTGLVRLLGGSLAITNGNSLGSGAIEFGSGNTLSTLVIYSNTTVANRFEIANSSSNSSIYVTNGATATYSGVLSQTNGTTNSTKFGKDGAGTLIFAGNGTYNGQIQVGQGSVIVATNNAIGTNITISARGVDLGLNVGDTSTVNDVSLLASNGVTVGQSIYVAPNTSSAKRTIGLSGTGTATFSNEIYLDGNLTVDAGSSGTVAITGVIATNYLGGGGGIITTNGTVILSGANTYNGGTTVGNGSTLKIGAGAGAGVLGGGNVTNNGTLVFDRTGAISWANLISGTGGLTKTNTGTLTLSGANTYSGDTTIQGGILQVSVTNNLGASNNAVTINNGGTLRTTANMTNARAITITSGTGYVEASSGTTNTLNGTLTKNGTTLVLGGAGTHIVNGSIVGANANSDLYVSNSTTTINSTNSYNGPTFIVAGGTLINGTNNALPTDTALTLGQSDDSASVTNTYNLSGKEQRVASIAATGTAAANIITNSTGTANLTLSNTVNTSFSNLKMGGSGLTLTKSGANTVTLTSGNTIGPGTIAIQQGTLLLGAANQIGDSTAITLSGGKLSTAGYADEVGKLTVSADSTIQGLNDTSGAAFTFSNIDLSTYSGSGGSTLTFLNSSGGNYSLGTVFQISTVAANSWTGWSTTSQNNFEQKIQFGNGNVGQLNFGSGISGTTLTVAAIPDARVYSAAVALVFLIGIAEIRRRRQRASRAV